MRTMIYNPSARIGGAISILKEVYYDLEEKEGTEQYFFVVGNGDFQNKKNIKILKFPWVQKNWFYRVFFDLFVAPRLVRKYKIDEIITYQNMTIPFTKVPQTMYLQQPLPFVDKKFSLRESKKLWLYQNVICKFVMKSVKNASKIIVQTQWMKRASIEKSNIMPEKIEVQAPKINFNPKYKYMYTNNTQKTFFFPASGLLYKNHRVVLDACLKLKENNINDYNVFFTLNGNESNEIKIIKEISLNNNLNINFIGHLNQDEVYNMYCKSVLLFPSYIETFGLPLLEAKLVGAPVIASESPFSREILDNYEKVFYFDAFNSQDLAGLMISFINSTKEVRRDLVNEKNVDVCIQ